MLLAIFNEALETFGDIWKNKRFKMKKEGNGYSSL